MPQISLYVDEPTYKKIKKAARANRTSISGFVRKSLEQSTSMKAWPEGFFELFGSIQDETFGRPDPLSFSQDAPREFL